jgi:predicted negative regulator of RcsB-dependent stress response
MFYYDHGQDMQKARRWIDAAVAERETHYIVYLKGKILAKLGDKAGAIEAAKRSTELAVKAEGSKSGYVKLNEDLVSSLR